MPQGLRLLCSSRRCTGQSMGKGNYRGLLGTQCAGKIRFHTFAGASRGADRVAAKRGIDMRAYYCGICGGYHMTSRPR